MRPPGICRPSVGVLPVVKRRTALLIAIAIALAACGGANVDSIPDAQPTATPATHPASLPLAQRVERLESQVSLLAQRFEKAFREESAAAVRDELAALRREIFGEAS